MDDTRYRLRFGNDARAYTPSAGERDGEGTFGNLAAESTGDWAWKPHRYRADTGIRLTGTEIRAMYPDGYARGAQLPEPLRSLHAAELEAQMPTYKPTLHPQAHRL